MINRIQPEHKAPVEVFRRITCAFTFECLPEVTKQSDYTIMKIFVDSPFRSWNKNTISGKTANESSQVTVFRRVYPHLLTRNLKTERSHDTIRLILYYVA